MISQIDIWNVNVKCESMCPNYIKIQALDSPPLHSLLGVVVRELRLLLNSGKIAVA